MLGSWTTSEDVNNRKARSVKMDIFKHSCVGKQKASSELLYLIYLCFAVTFIATMKDMKIIVDLKTSNSK
jgi:hypothetical protein